MKEMGSTERLPAIGVLRAFAAETCWCVERKTEGGPTARGGSEAPAFRYGGWGEPQPAVRSLQQLVEAAWRESTDRRFSSVGRPRPRAARRLK
jgi:hypothetical protein